MEPVRILVVDEDPGACRCLQDCLADGAGVVVQSAKSSEALRILQNENIGLLVLDAESCSMPVGEIVPIIHGINRDLPIIVTTHRNTPDLERQVRAQKIFYFHIKSFGASDLDLAVKNALEKTRARRLTDKEGP